MARDGDAASAATRYWDGVGAEWTGAHADSLWRGYCDRRNATLLSRWLAPGGPHAHILKTDVFDEAVSGGVIGVLRRHAARVTGIDVSPVMLRAAGARWPGLEVVAADVRRLPYRDGTFDAVVSISTLDHFESVGSIRTGLGELHRVLRRGGGLLVTLDNAAHPTVALRNRLPFGLLHRLGAVPYRVGATCGAGALRRMLQAAGFEVRVLTHVEHCPRWLAVRVARALARRRSSDRSVRAFLRVLERFESLERWPLRALTGHYVAAWAVKP